MSRTVFARARNWILERETEQTIVRLMGQGGRTALRAVRAMRTKLAVPDPTVIFGPGDILLLPDASWQTYPWTAIEHARAAGSRIVAVWYDVIPLERPEFFNAQLVARFSACFEILFRGVDDVIAISATTRNAIAVQIAKRNIPTPRLHVLWPGVALQEINPEPRSRLVESLANPAVLIVGTIEPRKGHELLLDAAEILWRDGISFNLVVAGRIGWNVLSLIQRFTKHAESGIRLHLLHDLTDAEIAYAMQRSRVLALPSCAEGFGLPIVEAELAGCPVVCSDIPVFREIASEHTVLFSPYDAAGLAAALRPFLVTNAPRISRDVLRAGRTSLSYREQAREFLELLRNTEKQQRVACNLAHADLSGGIALRSRYRAMHHRVRHPAH
jgi:glycosyltransferase involved in cell wall biosynthesis